MKTAMEAGVATCQLQLGAQLMTPLRLTRKYRVIGMTLVNKIAELQSGILTILELKERASSWVNLRAIWNEQHSF